MDVLRPPLIFLHINLRAGQVFINTLLHCIHQLLPRIERLRPDLMLKVKQEQIWPNLGFGLIFWQWLGFFIKMFFRFWAPLSLSFPKLPLDRVWNSVVFPILQDCLVWFQWSWITSACVLPSASSTWKVFKELGETQVQHIQCWAPADRCLGMCVRNSRYGWTCTKLQGGLWAACGTFQTLLVSCAWQVSELVFAPGHLPLLPSLGLLPRSSTI